MRERLESALRGLRGQMSRPPPPPEEEKEEDQASIRALTGDPMQVFRFGTLANYILSLLHCPFFLLISNTIPPLRLGRPTGKDHTRIGRCSFFFTHLNWHKKVIFSIFKQTFTTLLERKSCRSLRRSMSTWAETLKTSMALQWRWQGCRFEKKKTIFVFKIYIVYFP